MSDTIPTNEEVYRYDVEESVFIEADKWCEAQLGPRPEGVTPEIVQIAGRTLHGWWIQRAKPLVVVERGTMKRRRRSLAERMLAYEREVARRMEPLDGGFSMRRAGLEAEWRRMRPMDAEILDAMRAHPTHGMIEAHQVTAGQALETEVVEETAMRDHATHGMTGGETHQVTAGQALETEVVEETAAETHRRAFARRLGALMVALVGMEADRQDAMPGHNTHGMTGGEAQRSSGSGAASSSSGSVSGWANDIVPSWLSGQSSNSGQL